MVLPVFGRLFQSRGVGGRLFFQRASIDRRYFISSRNIYKTELCNHTDGQLSYHAFDSTEPGNEKT